MGNYGLKILKPDKPHPVPSRFFFSILFSLQEDTFSEGTGCGLSGFSFSALFLSIFFNTFFNIYENYYTFFLERQIIIQISIYIKISIYIQILDHILQKYKLNGKLLLSKYLTKLKSPKLNIIIIYCHVGKTNKRHNML